MLVKQRKKKEKEDKEMEARKIKNKEIGKSWVESLGGQQTIAYLRERKIKMKVDTKSTQKST